MYSYNKLIGNYGEHLASDFLVNNGYKILEKNFRTRYGEIDIIYTKNDLLIFCEIKSRYSNSYGTPIESITYHKQKQIIKLSKFYILKTKSQNYNVRYDVIEIYFNNKSDYYNLTHLKDAFRTY